MLGRGGLFNRRVLRAEGKCVVHDAPRGSAKQRRSGDRTKRRRCRGGCSLVDGPARAHAAAGADKALAVTVGTPEAACEGGGGGGGEGGRPLRGRTVRGDGPARSRRARRGSRPGGRAGRGAGGHGRDVAAARPGCGSGRKRGALRAVGRRPAEEKGTAAGEGDGQCSHQIERTRLYTVQLRAGLYTCTQQ